LQTGAVIQTEGRGCHDGLDSVRRFLRLGFAALAALGLSLSGALAADIEGSADHPLVGRYEGSEIVAYKVSEFDEVTVIEAPFDYVKMPAGTGFKTIEGKSCFIYYTLPQGRSTLEVLRNYEESLKGKGFEIVFTCATDKGTCFTSGQDEGGYGAVAIVKVAETKEMETDKIQVRQSVRDGAGARR
jgi:hypothetical protein